MVEIIYMMILIAYVFLALIVPASAIKWLISISVFFLNAYFVGHDGMCYANVFDLLEG
jgi:hypothetical protein